MSFYGNWRFTSANPHWHLYARSVPLGMFVEFQMARSRQFTVSIDDGSLPYELRVDADRQGVSFSGLVRRALNFYLDLVHDARGERKR